MAATDGRDEAIVRELTIEKPYLHLPVKNGVPRRLMRFVVEGREVREFTIELADAQPDFWVFADVSPFRGKQLQVHVHELPDARVDRSRDLLAAVLGVVAEPVFCA